MYATLGISIHTPNGVYTQRLTPEEAETLSKVLAKYSDVLKGLKDVDPVRAPADSV